MGTLSEKQIRRAIVVAAKAYKAVGERDERVDRTTEEETFGIVLPHEPSSLEKKLEEAAKAAHAKAKEIRGFKAKKARLKKLFEDDEGGWI